ncbi:UNVERIFIED_CONTAM: Brf1 [Trichonephila clavipes]
MCHSLHIKHYGTNSLLVAARLHNFNRTIDDIIKVVKVCQATVRKRLTEFSETPSGKLSIEDFMTVDLSEEQDPPSFKNARKKLRELEDESKMKELESQVTEFRKEIERILDNTRKKSRFFSTYGEINDDESSNASSSSRNVDMLIAENTLDSIKDVIGPDESCLPSVDNLVPLLAEGSQSLSENTPSTEFEYSSKELRPTLESLGVTDIKVSNEKPCENLDSDEDNNLDLTGLDDEELDRYFMKPCEYKKKDEVWHKFNADYLEELKGKDINYFKVLLLFLILHIYHKYSLFYPEREERRALEEEENAKKPPKKKRCVKKRDQMPASTPGEAMSKVFQQKKISHKLNYDILKSLNPDNSLEDLVEPELETDSAKANSNPPSVKSVRVRSRVKPTLSVPLNIKQGMSDIIGSNRRRVMAALAENGNFSQGSPTKKAKISETEISVKLESEEKEVIDLANDISNEYGKHRKIMWNSFFFLFPLVSNIAMFGNHFNERVVHTLTQWWSHRWCNCWSQVQNLPNATRQFF